MHPLQVLFGEKQKAQQAPFLQASHSPDLLEQLCSWAISSPPTTHALDPDRAGNQDQYGEVAIPESVPDITGSKSQVLGEHLRCVDKCDPRGNQHACYEPLLRAAAV